MSTMETKARSTQILQSIRSMIVLYGSVRGTRLSRDINRSLLDLPLVSGSVLEHHLANAQACARRFDLRDFEMRVLVDTESLAPTEPKEVEGVRCVIQQDASPIRGVAGVLSDATKEMNDDDYIIVSSGSQVYLERLDDLVHAMVKKDADVVMVSSKDGSPVGVWLIRCGVLKSVSSVGYVDMKEQSLEAWKMHHKVCVVERSRSYAHSTRSLMEYLGAIRAESAGFGAGATIDEDPYREEWESVFSIVEPGSKVASGAILHDSVVLEGASVGKDAVVVRSVLCSGAVVAPGARVIEQVLSGVAKKERRP